MYEKFFLLAAMLIASAGSGYAALLYAQSLFGTATLPRAIYSGLLVLVAILLVREISNVWKPSKVGIGKFEVSDSGDVDTIRAAALRGLIEQRYNLIRTAFERENQRRSALAPDEDGVILERVAVPTPEATLGKASNALSEIELTFQGVNFGQIFSSLRRRVAPPNEITGQVVDKDGISGVVNWPRGPKFAHLPLENVRIMTFERLNTDGDLALKIACSLVWAQVVESGEASAAQMPRVDYCTWVEAFLLSEEMRRRISAGLTLDNDHQRRIARAIEALSPLVANAAPYSDVYWTQSELMRLSGRSNTVAQADRIERLALLMEEGRNATDARAELVRLEQQEAQAATAAARPVQLAEARDAQLAQLRSARPIDLSKQPGASAPAIIPMSPPGGAGAAGGPTGPATAPPLTAAVPPRPSTEPAEPVSPEVEALRAISRATGFVELAQSGQPFSGTAFVVAPDIIVTADFVFDATFAKGPADALARFPIRFSTAGLISDEDDPGFEAQLLSRHPDRQIAFLRVPGLEAAGITPVPLATEAPALGADAGVVAYPVFDPRLPPDAQAVGRDDPTRKLLLRGAFIGASIETNAQGPLLYNDVPTTGGSAGGPLVDLEQGKVVGVHLGGIISEKEKRNYAAQLLADDAILP